MASDSSPTEHLLPVVHGATIHVFDCSALTWLSPITIVLPPTDYFFEVGDAAGYVEPMFLSDGRVFLMRQFYDARAYVVDQSGAVRELPGNKHNYPNGAKVEYEGAVYLFGGSQGHCMGERVSLTDGSWTPTCWMTDSRYILNGVLWHDCIYLCGGLHAPNSIDVYSPRTDTMQRLRKVLPESGSPTLAFVSGEELVVLSQKWSTKYRCNGDQLVKVSERSFNDQFRLFSIASPPVVIRGKVFINYQEGILGAWHDIETRMQLGWFNPIST